MSDGAMLVQGNLARAIQCYTQAIGENYSPDMHVYYSNRSAAHAKAGNLDDALKGRSMLGAALPLNALRARSQAVEVG